MKILFLTIITMVSVTDGYFKFILDSADVLNEASDAAEAVLTASGINDSFLSIITDETVYATSIRKFTRKLETHSGVVLFKIQTTRDQNFRDLASNLRQLHRSTKYPNMVVVSDKIWFLSSLLESLFEDNILVWTTRLLVVTRRSLSEVHPMRVMLSKVNCMILIHETKADFKGCRVFTYIPYSHRSLELATWSKHTGVNYKTRSRMFPEKFDKLEDGAHMKLTAEIYPPLIMAKEKYDARSGSEDPTEVLRGPLIEVLKILANSVNFTCSWSRPTDVAFGYQFPNGSWGGMVGMVARKDVDFSFLIFTVLYTRAQVVDYSLPVTFTYARFLARKGKTEIDPWGFTAPFTSTVWLSFLLSILLVVSVAFGMSLVLPESQNQRWNYSVNNYLRVLLLQDPETQSVQYWSSSVLAATWMIAVLIMIASYVGNLRSIFSVRYVPQPYHSIKAVMEDPSVEIITETGGYYHQSIKSGFFRELTDAGKESTVSYVEFTDFEKVVDNEISKGGYVLMNDDLPSKMLIDHHFSMSGSCLFYMSKELFFPQISAMIAPKYSPLIRVFNKRLTMIIESGLYDHWVRREYVNSSSCEGTPTRILVKSPLSFFNIWGTFMILACGFFPGFVIFALELGSKRAILLCAD